MKHVTAFEMSRIDERAIREFGIPSLLLMENAGAACALEALRMAGEKSPVIFAGKGNNGGDGFVAARHLANRGLKPVVCYFQKPAGMKPDPLVNFRILEKMKVSLIDCSGELPARSVTRALKNAGVVVDALFGTGLSKPVSGIFETVIAMINEAGVKVLAVDIPSGLNSDTGEVMGCCVKAAVTVTLGLPKRGFLKREAKRYTGRVKVADISIPGVLLK